MIRGNHDRACAGLDDLEWFNPIARTATLWTIGQLTGENVMYLRALPEGPLAVDDFSLAHGSPLDEDEYVRPGLQETLHLPRFGLEADGHDPVALDRLAARAAGGEAGAFLPRRGRR